RPPWRPDDERRPVQRRRRRQRVRRVVDRRDARRRRRVERGPRRLSPRGGGRVVRPLALAFAFAFALALPGLALAAAPAPWSLDEVVTIEDATHAARAWHVAYDPSVYSNVWTLALPPEATFTGA